MLDDLPKGFSAATAEANFKKAGRDDLGLIFSDRPCELGAMFTTNLFCAAPVQIDKSIVAGGGQVRAVVANSGQANACTGEEGLNNCRIIQQKLSKLLGIKPEEILLLSTGVIGDQLKMEKWELALPKLPRNLGQKDAEGFTRAFMTTDAFPKFLVRDFELSTGSARLCVMAKGAGMICPNMATMLCVVLTDAGVDKTDWQAMFRRAVNKTFNRVCVDGDTSTNDTVLGLANGAAAHVANEKDTQVLENLLTEILAKVAYMLVKDGEGASKVMHIKVKGAKDNKNAELVARAIGNSQLVKTAIYGGDANWGRIVNAIGYSGAQFDPHEVSLILCGIERFRKGQPVNGEYENILAEKLKANDIDMEISMGRGNGCYELKASDLGHEYVTLNSDYRS